MYRLKRLYYIKISFVSYPQKSFHGKGVWQENVLIPGGLSEFGGYFAQGLTMENSEAAFTW